MACILGLSVCWSWAGGPPKYNLVKVPFAAGFGLGNNPTILDSPIYAHISNDGSIYAQQRKPGKPTYLTFKYGKDMVPQTMETPVAGNVWSAFGFSRSGKNFVWSPTETGSVAEATDHYLVVDGQVIKPPKPKYQNYTIDRVKFTQINDDGIAVGVAELDHFGTVRWGVRYDTRTGEYQLGKNEAGHVDEVYWSINNAGQILAGANGFISNPNALFLHEANGMVKPAYFGSPAEFILTEQGNIIVNLYDNGIPNGAAKWTNGVMHTIHIDLHYGPPTIKLRSVSSTGTFVGRQEYSINGIVSNFVGVGDTLYMVDELLNHTSVDADVHVLDMLSINDSGQIVTLARNYKTKEYAYYLLQPVPEPGTWLVVGAGLVILSRRRC